ncbi:hypothetical protein [Sphingobacterium paramultivorum]|uniref:hypothetical protein n=1 Tax=Sphingobacterium paramultivorum TaxID=2886510 RepID=UPI00129CC5BD|nr:hypothetical protein [Sphingobacterium paramultivorum]
MRRILVVGASLGLTGCQMIRLQEASIVLSKVGIGYNDAMQGLQRVAQNTIIEKEDLQSVISAAGKALAPFHEPVKEKKQKYIRQQHKLAQRHYRRK